MYGKVTLAIALVLISAIDLSAQNRDIKINIYSGGFSQVTETRDVDLKKGLSAYELYDIAEKIDPGSISIGGDGLEIRNLDYRYDFVSAERLLYKFIGKEIQFQKGDSLVKGILLRYDDKYLFLAAQGWPGPVSIYERDELKHIDLPTLPEGLVSRPMINVVASSDKSGTRPITLSYLTEGLGWNAEYRLAYGGKDEATFSGWVKLDNQSGISFPDASVILVAGQLDREKSSGGSSTKSEEGVAQEAGKSPLEPLLDYHRYELPFKSSLGEKETRQAALFQATSIKVDHYYKYQWSETKSDVKSLVSFKNEPKSGLGFPLPPGRISIYDRSTDAFLGSGTFDGAAAGEKAELFMGTAFDVKAERKRTDHKKIGRNKNSDTFEIKIRNHKVDEIRIVVSEELYGYWDIIEKSDDFAKKDFQTIEFDVRVPAGAEKAITYTVEYGY